MLNRDDCSAILLDPFYNRCRYDSYHYCHRPSEDPAGCISKLYYFLAEGGVQDVSL